MPSNLPFGLRRGMYKCREKQNVADGHEYHSLFCYSAEWSSGKSTPHNGTKCSRIISRVVHLHISLLYSKATRGQNVLVFFFCLFVFCCFHLYLLTYSVTTFWNKTNIFNFVSYFCSWPQFDIHWFFSILQTCTIMVLEMCFFTFFFRDALHNEEYRQLHAHTFTHTHGRTHTYIIMFLTSILSTLNYKWHISQNLTVVSMPQNGLGNHKNDH